MRWRRDGLIRSDHGFVPTKGVGSENIEFLIFLLVCRSVYLQADRPNSTHTFEKWAISWLHDVIFPLSECHMPIMVNGLKSEKGKKCEE